MTEDPKSWKPETRLVRGGLDRSAHGETAEALFLTQGYVYDTAEAAEARFKGDEPGFVYSRYANPTNRMFEERMALLEGAEGCRTATTWSPAFSRPIMAMVTAAIPEVAVRQPSAPSSSAIRSSNMRLVGLA